MIDDLNCHGDKALTMKPISILTKIISRINYLSLARSRINLSIGIPPHIFTNLYNTTKPDRWYRISHLNYHGDKALTIKPTSVLTKIIPRINYLSLVRSRINLLICISPNIFTLGTVLYMYKTQVIDCIWIPLIIQIKD